jgi:hypothetical protein
MHQQTPVENSKGSNTPVKESKDSKATCASSPVKNVQKDLAVC